MLRLFVIKRRIPYEGDDVWIVAAINAVEAKKLIKIDPNFSYDVQLLSHQSDYNTEQIVWTNA